MADQPKKSNVDAMIDTINQFPSIPATTVVSDFEVMAQTTMLMALAHHSDLLEKIAASLEDLQQLQRELLSLENAKWERNIR